jgi:hypothetical protein
MSVYRTSLVQSLAMYLHSIHRVIGGISGSVIRDVLPVISHWLILGIFIYKHCARSNIYLHMFGKFYMDIPSTVAYRAR